MKLSLTQENLSRALGMVGRIVGSRSSLPVLNNVLLSTEGGRLRIAATNLELGINCRVGGKIEAEGSVTVPAKLLSEFISSLPNGNIELSADGANLSVKTPHYESQINGISADEFPLIPEIKGKPLLTLPVEQFKDALVAVAGAASLDEARPVLSGVYLYNEGKKLFVVATDSYRLAEQTLALPQAPEKDISLIVPARTMLELGRILAETSGEINLYLSENQIMFEGDSVELVSRLIEGQFPNYRQIIPEKTETTAEVDTAEFARIVKVANLFARENAGAIKVEVKEGAVSASSAASEVGENNSSIDCEMDGKDNEISLNARYLSEALANIKAEKVKFSISGKLNPCVIRPAGKKTEAQYLHIIMPLRT